MQNENKTMQNNQLSVKISIYKDDELLREEVVSTFDDAEELLGSMERNWNKDVEEFEAREESMGEDYPLGGNLEPVDIEKEKEFLKDTDNK